MRLARRAALVLLATPAFAQTWPGRRIRLIIPFPPGSGTDVLGRLLNEPLSRALGQPVVIENRPGGNGTVGTAAAALAAPVGTPAPIIARANAALNQVLTDAAVNTRLHQLGYAAFPSTPAEFGDYLKQQLAVWGERIRIAGLQPQ